MMLIPVVPSCVNSFPMVPLHCHYITNFSNQPTPGIQTAFNKAVPGLDAPCNQECHCDNIPITPVCGIDQRHYFSPCHAGCEDMVLDGETKKVRITRHWNIFSWWRHQIETFSALLALCAGNSPVTGEFPSQMPVIQSFDVFIDMCLDKRLNKQSRRRWFETPRRSFWRHCKVLL